MTSPIIARADALMQRSRRPAGDDDEIPLLTDAIDEEEDGLPLLIDMAGDEDGPSQFGAGGQRLESPAPAETPVPAAGTPATIAPAAVVPVPAPAPHPTLDLVFRDLLAGEVAARVEKRIGELLPGIVNETVCEVLTELVEGQPRK